jgi:hypothetical protein
MDKGILISQPNVLALLAKRKLRTMRPMKVQPPKDAAWIEYNDKTCITEELRGKVSWFVPCDAHQDYYPCNREDAIKPRCQPGDMLYVKETHYRYGKWLKNGKTETGRQKWRFKALNDDIKYHDNCPVFHKNSYRKEGWYKRPSLFMPKKHARIWLPCTKVTVQRPQDLSIADIRAEGIQFGTAAEQQGRLLWKQLYISIYGLDEWKANLWHFVYHWEDVIVKGERHGNENILRCEIM